MNLEKRIRNLESRLLPRFITLTMPDNTTRRIQANGRHWLELVCAASRRYYYAGLGKTLTSEFDNELDLISKSTGDNAEEMGHGQMVNVIRLALNADPGNPEINAILDQSDIGDGDES